MGVGMRIAGYGGQRMGEREEDDVKVFVGGFDEDNPLGNETWVIVRRGLKSGETAHDLKGGGREGSFLG